MWSKPRLVVVATVATCALLLAVFTGLGYQRYTAVQADARNELRVVAAQVHSQLTSFQGDKSAIEDELTRGDQVLTESSGKTLDESTRKALTDAMTAARDALAQQTQRVDKLQEKLDNTSREVEAEIAWPPDALQTVRTFADSSEAGKPHLGSVVSTIETRITAVKAAEVAWQTEQDRLAAVAAAEAAAAAAAAAEQAAADEAARRSAPRTIPSTGSITDSGGVTPPSAPAPPAEPVAPIPGFNVEAFVASIAPNAYISWVPGLCSGFYVCGRTWVGGAQTAPIMIQLDPTLRDIYANSVGVSVLVHESAHARQWLYYGGNLVAANEALTASTGQTGTLSVEYMADCATIVKLGYSTGSYTSSCTADQMAAAALIW